MTNSNVRRLVWFRNDLRIDDNPALLNACKTEDKASPNVLAIYVICGEFFEKHFTAPSRIDFIARHLEILTGELRKLRIPLLILNAASLSDLESRLISLVEREQISELYFNAEYPLDEFKRDQTIAALLREKNIRVKRFHDRVIVAPGLIRNQQGNPYRVFTPFKRAWIQTVQTLPLTPLSKPNSLPPENLTIWSNDNGDQSVDSPFSKYERKDLSHIWKAGAKEAHKRFDLFVDKFLFHYHETRDFPAMDTTSHLSPYLAIGSISPKQLLSTVLSLNHGEFESGSSGVTTWINELIWREFYQHVMVDFPQVCQFKPMQAYTELFPWKHDEQMFSAWCRGVTGIPIVDAAMRQLNETGWMHNRLRMVTAMFLTKNLQIDWRWGEKYFMSELIDGDFAANNGGWQWCASTGTDAAPYFRIFNPISQSEKFDPEGKFIRRFVSELKGLSNKEIHSPPAMANYPAPIVDLSASRKSTIAQFSAIKQL